MHCKQIPPFQRGQGARWRVLFFPCISLLYSEGPTVTTSPIPIVHKPTRFMFVSFAICDIGVCIATASQEQTDCCSKWLCRTVAAGQG